MMISRFFGESLMIRLYCVGIHFNKQVGFVPDLDASGKKEGEAGVGELVFMSGEAIFKAAQDQYDLRYQLTAPGSRVPGHIAHVGYTPKKGDHPRITFNVSFPYYGVPLSLTEVLNPIGQLSYVLQYSIQAEDRFKVPTPKTLYPTGPQRVRGDLKTGDAQFATNGFPDECEIRVRLLSIYCCANG